MTEDTEKKPRGVEARLDRIEKMLAQLVEWGFDLRLIEKNAEKTDRRLAEHEKLLRQIDLRLVRLDERLAKKGRPRVVRTRIGDMQRVFAAIAASGERGLERSELSRRTQFLTAAERNTALRDLGGRIISKRQKTGSRPRTVFWDARTRKDEGG